MMRKWFKNIPNILDKPIDIEIVIEHTEKVWNEKAKCWIYQPVPKKFEEAPK